MMLLYVREAFAEHEVRDNVEGCLSCIEGLTTEEGGSEH
jgi:hypothetical protein